MEIYSLYFAYLCILTLASLRLQREHLSRAQSVVLLKGRKKRDVFVSRLKPHVVYHVHMPYIHISRDGGGGREKEEGEAGPWQPRPKTA